MEWESFDYPSKLACFFIILPVYTWSHLKGVLFITFQKSNFFHYTQKVIELSIRIACYNLWERIFVRTQDLWFFLYPSWSWSLPDHMDYEAFSFHFISSSGKRCFEDDLNRGLELFYGYYRTLESVMLNAS